MIDHAHQKHSRIIRCWKLFVDGEVDSDTLEYKGTHDTWTKQECLCIRWTKYPALCVFMSLVSDYNTVVLLYHTTTYYT